VSVSISPLPERLLLKDRRSQLSHTEGTPMQKIIPHLWFDKEAQQAAEFYSSVFPASQVTNITTIHDTPSGVCDIVSFQVWGYAFMAISAGPMFKINPSVSFMVNFDPAQDRDARARIDQVWGKLSAGGNVLMPLDKYPFSERYGWVQDKYGLSWQLILTNPEGEERPIIIPSLLFVGDVYGKAEEASDFYLSVFSHSKRGVIARYGAGQAPDKEGAVMFTDFMLEGQWFAAMDSAHEHHFKFNEAVSLMVNCDTQQEIDHYWKKLSAVPQAEQCGWLKDQYGLSWQIVPRDLDEMMRSGTPEQMARVTQAFLKMKKFDLAALRRAYEG
jgi:predicted 3-demethylubiquinone-9 3-methyltransferase (glyoxalase superfamily)